jgi:predicted DNA binding protein
MTMWNLKFSVRNVDSVYTHLTEKFDIVDYFYPVDRFRRDGKIHILSIHLLQGKEENKGKFARALKNHKQVIHFERDQNRIVMEIVEEEQFYETLFDPELYLPEPVIIKDGHETWRVAAWDREKLSNLMHELEQWPKRLLDLDIKAIAKENLHDVYFPRILPKLPPRQKKAYEIAVKNGYYTFPRLMTLERLAVVMGVSAQTYHEHLRKAEAKLLPFFSENADINVE